MWGGGELVGVDGWRVDGGELIVESWWRGFRRA